MDSNIVARQLLDKICDIDPNMKNAMTDKPTETHVMNLLTNGFAKITKNFPHLVEDIQRRVVEYHTNRGTTGGIADFIQIVEWYGMSLEDKPVEYFDPNEKYYGLRMSEVIDMFLIAKHQF